MTTAFKISAYILLIFNGTGAMYGGWNLIIHPDGSGLQMTTDYLQYSPFSDYLIPGIILFTANGLFSIVVLCMTLFNYKHFPLFIIMQGAVLTGWIAIQILMAHIVYYLHIVLGIAGLLLILCGWKLLKRK